MIHNLGTNSKSFITWELETMSASNPNKIKESAEKIRLRASLITVAITQALASRSQVGILVTLPE